MADPRVSGASPLNALALHMLREAAEQEQIVLVESERDLEQWFEQEAFNPAAMLRRFRTLDEFKAGRQPGRTEKEDRTEKKVKEIEKIEEVAARFQRNNEELQAKTLLFLSSRISAGDSPEEALRKVLELYPEPALADEALEFLMASGDPRIAEIARQAKERLNSQFERSIKAGRNMGASPGIRQIRPRLCQVASRTV